MQVIFKSISLLELVIFLPGAVIWAGLLWWLRNDEHAGRNIAGKHFNQDKNYKSVNSRR